MLKTVNIEENCIYNPENFHANNYRNTDNEIIGKQRSYCEGKFLRKI